MLATIPKTECPAVPENLEHAHRLAAMGELAAGLAHEIQQRLTVIANYANGCVHRLENDRISPEELKSLLKEIAATAVQANQITRRARNFSKKQAPNLELLDLNQTVQQGVDFVRLQAEDARVKISLNLYPSSPQVLADQTQLSQVVINLLLNAIEALADHHGKRNLCVETTADGDDYVQLTVSDTGPGIPADTQLLVFEPFYTTKANGLGIGLGLCRSIIDQHHGKMVLESEVDNGTRIGFSLPRLPID